jgi:hypothetical protein
VPVYIPQKSEENTHQACAKLGDLADAFDRVARDKRSSWLPKQRRVAETYVLFATDAREISAKVDQRDIRESMDALMDLHTGFLGLSLSTGLPKSHVPGVLNPLGEQMSAIQNLMAKAFFKMRDAHFGEIPPATPKV